jgi:hypothetical protein
VQAAAPVPRQPLILMTHYKLLQLMLKRQAPALTVLQEPAAVYCVPGHREPMAHLSHDKAAVTRCRPGSLKEIFASLKPGQRPNVLRLRDL